MRVCNGEVCGGGGGVHRIGLVKLPSQHPVHRGNAVCWGHSSAGLFDIGYSPLSCVPLHQEPRGCVCVCVIS